MRFRSWRSSLSPTRLVAFVLVVGVASAVGAAGTTATTGGGIVTGCTTIDDPGHYVILSDVTDRSTDACVVVTASNVTVDGRGHVVDGVESRSGTVGIRVGSADGPAPENVTVRNVTVTRFEDGVVADGSVDLANVTATDLAGDGVVVTAGKGSVLVADLAVERVDGRGLVVTGGPDLEVRNATVAGAGGDGVRVEVSGTVSVSGTTVVDTGGYGVYVDAGGSTAVFEGLRIRGSTEEGLEVLGTADVTVDGLHVSAVRGGPIREPYDGVYLDVAGTLTLANVTVRDVPSGRGVFAYAATGNGTVRLDGVTVSGVGGDGVVLGSYADTDLAVTGLAVRNASGRALVVSGGTATLSAVTVGPVELGGTGRYFAVAASTADPPSGFDVAGGPLAVTLDGGRLDVGLRFEPPADGSGVGLYRRGPDGWSGVPNASVDRTAGVASASLTADATVAVLSGGSGPLAPYTGEDGVVDDAGLARAVEDWVEGEISDELLNRVVRSWVRGSPVGTAGRTPSLRAKA